MRLNTKKRWTPEEEEILFSMLQAGADLDQILSRLPDRNEGSVIRRASSDKYGYGYDTVNGKVFFYADIKRNANHAGKRSKSSHRPVAEVNIVNVIDDILPTPSLKEDDRGLVANAKAIEILQHFDLPITPTIIMQLSTHIIKANRSV